MIYASAVVANLVLLASFASATEWELTKLRPVTTLIGVYATSESEVWGAAGDNAQGVGLVHSTDYGATGEFVGPAGSMNMDVAFTSTGTGAMAALGGIYLSNDKTTWTKASTLHGVTQNVETFGTSSIGTAGGFTTDFKSPSVNGVAVSHDNGATWSISDIGLNSTLYLARYGAYPSSDTWYVTSGSWPYDSSVKEGKFFTKNIYSYFPTIRYHVPESKNMLTEGGYPGAISKTTDAGKTWTKVFDTDGLMYFNEINCFDDLHCVAAAEGDSVAGAYLTTDGGATWSLSVTAPAGASCVGAKMISATEAWVSGGAKERGAGLVGYYYHTVDGGKSWELLKSSTGISFDLSFSGSVGYSAVINENSCTIAIYR